MLDESNVLITNPDEDDDEIGGSSEGGSPKSDPEDGDITPRLDDEDEVQIEAKVEDQEEDKALERSSMFHPRSSIVSA